MVVSLFVVYRGCFGPVLRLDWDEVATLFDAVFKTVGEGTGGGFKENML